MEQVVLQVATGRTAPPEVGCHSFGGGNRGGKTFQLQVAISQLPPPEREVARVQLLEVAITLEVAISRATSGSGCHVQLLNLEIKGQQLLVDLLETQQ